MKTICRTPLRCSPPPCPPRASPVTSGSRDALFVSDGSRTGRSASTAPASAGATDLEGFPDRLEASYYGGLPAGADCPG